MNSEQNLTVAVITPTLGRESLIKAIESVQQQTYPCKHYIFVDGEKYHKAVKKMVKPYPNIEVIYLPMNTGGTAKKLLNSAINSAATFLVEEDIICYLDDDNWYNPQHVEYLVQDMHTYQADYAYSLRYFVDKQGDVICADDIVSLGFWLLPRVETELTVEDSQSKTKMILKLIHGGIYLIDTNCIAFRRELAQRLSLVWIENGLINDRNVTQFLLTHDYVGICTGQYAVYYFIDFEKTHNLDKQIQIDFDLVNNPERLNQFFVELYRQQQQRIYLTNQDKQGKLAWQYKTMIKNGELFRVE